MSTFPFRATGTLFKADQKPVSVERKEKQRAVRTSESKHKTKVRERDGKAFCRLFGDACQYRTKGLFETAHIDGKGMGGDHGLRSTTANMLRACHSHHQGRRSLHSKHLRVEFLTPKKADGSIRVWERQSTKSQDWTLVREEKPDVVSDDRMPSAWLRGKCEKGKA